MTKKLFLIAFLLFASVPGSFAGTGQAVPQSLAKQEAAKAFSWSEGVTKYSSITNCVSIIQGTPYVENGIGTYVGFYADANAAKPAPNSVYYVHVVVAGLGNSCSGMRVYIDISLPPNTSLAISQVNKVAYYYDNVLLSANESPQSLPASTYNPGAFQVLSVDSVNGRTWPIPQGRILEIQVPVVSATALTNSTLQANVWALDGNSSPWLRPTAGVFVFGAAPSILYSAPSTDSISKTTGRSVATVYTNGAAGTGYFDLGTTVSYGLIHDPVPLSTANTSWQVWDKWGPPSLSPGTLYHWRFTFTMTATGQTYYGADQTFTTLSDQVTSAVPKPVLAGRSTESSGKYFDALGRARLSATTGSNASTGGAGFAVRKSLDKPREKRVFLSP
jgi:hypothetical protein